MGSGYQKRDFEVIDYNLYHLPKIKHPLRGPANNKLKKNNYICCIGAAQTFGCYVDEPYPYLIQKELNISTLNLGFSGAGPSFFLNKKHYLRYINNGKFAILQVLSGRSESNSLLLSRNGKGMLELNGESMPAAKAYQFIVDNYDIDFINKLINETRDNYMMNMKQLINKINVPIILLWFSKRTPEYAIKFDNNQGILGSYPHLINQEMIDEMKNYCTDYVEVVSSKGLPQKLFSRFTKEAVSVNKMPQLGGGKRGYNSYYPSPEMHKKASEKLIKVCKKLV